MTTPIAQSRQILPLALAALLAAPAARAGDPPSGHEHAMPGKVARPASPAAERLEKLKALAGTWTGKAEHGGSPAGDVSAVWRVTGNGSAVTETIMPGTPHEMLTVYHLDGDQLVLTHYCAAGNQPSMRALPGKDPSSIAFDFTHGSNMRPGDMHMHSARIAFAGEDRIQTEWTSWKDGKPAGAATFTLLRQK